MNSPAKTAAFALLLVLAASTLNFAQAESSKISVPSVPEFTAQLVDHSYTEPESTQTNPYTGETTIKPAHHVENYTVELTIKNQPYSQAPVTIEGATWTPEFRYDVNVKGHFEPNWTIMYPLMEGPKSSNSDYTTITYVLRSDGSDQSYELTNPPDATDSNSLTGIPKNSQVDFRVRAILGSMHRGYDSTAKDQISMFPWVFEGETSAWSSTQTVTIPPSEGAATENSTSNTQNTQTAASGDGESMALVTTVIVTATAIVIVTVFVAAILVRKAQNQSRPTAA